MYLSCYSGVWGEMLLHPPPFHEGGVTPACRRLRMDPGVLRTQGGAGNKRRMCDSASAVRMTLKLIFLDLDLEIG